MPKLQPLSTVRIIPSARRLVTSMRDLGYDFVHAVADIVDNSLAANATEVHVDLQFAGSESWLSIGDNGSGMSAESLNEAMRFGADREYSHNDLGKFGLGLKTASLSQCRRLVVASRTGSHGAVEVRCLDLDHIERTDRWEVLVLSPSDGEVRAALPPKSSGTVVCWKTLDRMMDYKLPYGGKARSGLEALSEQLRDHLGMVFHRFISGEVRGKGHLVITVNGRRVHPWDPFALGEHALERLPAVEIDVRNGEAVGLVRFRPFVLPPEKSFSSVESFRRLAGPAKWNNQQGFYIYRANRLIQSGGWCRMRTADEHAKLARASIDFFPELDAAFEVNVAKARVNLPLALRERLTSHVEQWVRRAQAVYRAAGSESEMRGGSSCAIPTSPVQTPPPIARAALERAARNVGESAALRRIVRELRGAAPGIAELLGWSRGSEDKRSHKEHSSVRSRARASRGA